MKTFFNEKDPIIKFGGKLGLLFIWLTIVILLCIWFFAYFNFDFAKLGTLGDTIGGLLNPIIAFSVAILTFLAFYVQYRANIEVKEQFKIQQFESQFYNMLTLHRENVSEMNIADEIVGRKCFVRMFYEFKFIHLSLYAIYKSHKKEYNWDYKKVDLINISYIVFFYGIGSVSDRITLKLIDEKFHPLLVLLIEILSKNQDCYADPSCFNINAVETEDELGVFNFDSLYFPFDGHSTRLGHYYRHLFQTVSYIVDSEVIPERLEKYKYLKMIRAQLSNHEQLLLYYNSLTTYGSEWISNDYFTKHRMIKNIPLNMADFGKQPKDLLGEKNEFGEFLFEWDEK